MRADSYAFRTLSRSSSSWSARSTYGLTLLAASETLSFVLAIVGGSFRLLARAVVPLALLFILAACGGSTQRQGGFDTRVQGPGFSFAAPSGWKATRTADRVPVAAGREARRLGRRLSAAEAVPARALRGGCRRSSTASPRSSPPRTRVALSRRGDDRRSTGRKVRAYRYTAGDSTRIGFVLVGKREFQLLCRCRPTVSRRRRRVRAALLELQLGGVAAPAARRGAVAVEAERDVEDLLDRVDEDELQLPSRLGRQARRGRARSPAAGSRAAARRVARRAPSRARRRSASTWPGQRDLARHADLGRHRRAAHERRDRRRHRDARRRAVLRHRAGGHVDVHVVLGEPVRPADRARSACERTHESAACADSCITSPSWPVIVSFPLPGYACASMKSTSPPAAV